MEKQITQCDEAIATLIAQDVQLAHKASRLKAIPGGRSGRGRYLCWPKCPNWERSPAEPPPRWRALPLTTATAADKRGVVPSRAGAARRGTRFTWATLTAMRYDRILKEFYLRLRAAGKKPLVAMTACMRKLVILMNRLLKNNDFQLAN
ncbi:MAG: hypothetical protein WDN00_09115 [Limisphaerales bacterium]